MTSGLTFAAAVATVVSSLSFQPDAKPIMALATIMASEPVKWSQTAWSPSPETKDEGQMTHQMIRSKTRPVD